MYEDAYNAGSADELPSENEIYKTIEYLYTLVGYIEKERNEIHIFQEDIRKLEAEAAFEFDHKSMQFHSAMRSALATTQGADLLLSDTVSSLYELIAEYEKMAKEAEQRALVRVRKR